MATGSATRARVAVDRNDLGFLLAKSAQRWNELLQEGFRAAGYGEIRPSYGSVLLPLYEQDGLRMMDLADRARLSKQTMTTMVRLLERDGLVQRDRDPSDGRAFRIKLTDRAHAFRPVAEDVLNDIDRMIRDQLSSAELACLRGALRKVMQL